jgi:hypothetical protein
LTVPFDCGTNAYLPSSCDSGTRQPSGMGLLERH